MDTEHFVEECRFAKVVETEEGPALLIGGHVLRVSGPANFYGFGDSDKPTINYVLAIATALRGKGGGAVSSASGTA